MAEEQDSAPKQKGKKGKGRFLVTTLLVLAALGMYVGIFYRVSVYGP